MNNEKNSKESRTIGIIFATIVMACLAAVFIALTWNLISWILNI